jgi:hypothetical protein
MSPRGFLVVLLALPLGCGTPPPGASPQAPPAPAPTPPPTEALALVEHAVDVDVFGPLPVELRLPADAEVENGRAFGYAGKTKFSRRTLEVRFPGNWARFEREVAAPIASSLTAPDGTAIVFRYDKSFGDRRYSGEVVRTKVLAGLSDLTKVEVVADKRVVVNLDTNATTESTAPALELTFSADAVKRLEAHAERPVAWLTGGRVIRLDDQLGKFETRRLVLDWPDADEARAAAEKAAAAFRAR